MKRGQQRVDLALVVGCAARVLKALKHSSGNYSLILQGLTRIRLRDVTQGAPYLKAKIERLEEAGLEDDEAEALSMSLRDIAKQVIQLMPELPREAGSLIDSIQAPGALADLVAANLDAPVEEKAQLIETIDVKERIRKVLRLLTRQLEILKMRERINSQIKEEMGKNQREYVLRQQLKAIKEELGEDEGDQGDLDGLEDRIAKANLPTEAETVAKKQLKRLRTMQVGSAEYTVVRTYLDWILDIPWTQSTTDNLDISAVRKVLDEDHYGLEKVKKRILEYLAVRKLKKDKKGPILLFIGPPGVGKTSLGKSIARSMGRRYERIALGGVRDEAEIRGHRRTYVGALPGRILQALKKAGTKNPVLVLDEVDKMGVDLRGDPAAALLEVLDSEQNHSFGDHYLDLDYDLSKVIFLCTANELGAIPDVLRDRLEVIPLSGYTVDEKLAIAREHLLPRQRAENGLRPEQVEIADDVLLSLATAYTRESGVRNIERELAALLRDIAMHLVEGKQNLARIDADQVLRILGPPRYHDELAAKLPAPGVVTGLGWTPVGGTLLFVEANISPGTGQIRLTGKLGDVMKESAQAALSWVRAHSAELGIDANFFELLDIHLHVPQGAISKDGPSAGNAILSAIVSLLTGRRVRPDVAMTGEITLRGAVLPVGGIKSKMLAAHRAGIKTVILPERNQKDLIEVPEEVRAELTFVPVNNVRVVLDTVLERTPGSKLFASSGSADPTGLVPPQDVLPAVSGPAR